MIFQALISREREKPLQQFLPNDFCPKGTYYTLEFQIFQDFPQQCLNQGCLGRNKQGNLFLPLFLCYSGLAVEARASAAFISKTLRIMI
jgi:hypothetical protein